MVRYSNPTLRYMGLSSFLWTSSSGYRVLIDPYQNPQYESPWFVRAFPPVSADLVLITHNHFDHNAIYRIAGTPSVLRGSGNFETEGLKVMSVRGEHATLRSRLRDNLVFTLGRYDLVAIGEAPNAEAITKALLSWSSRGLLRTETLTGFTGAEISELINEI